MSGELVAAAPAPWTIDHYGQIRDADGVGLGMIYRHGPVIEGTPRDRATAQLVGSAPLLVEACEAARDALCAINVACGTYRFVVGGVEISPVVERLDAVLAGARLEVTP